MEVLKADTIVGIGSVLAPRRCTNTKGITSGFAATAKAGLVMIVFGVVVLRGTKVAIVGG